MRKDVTMSWRIVNLKLYSILDTFQWVHSALGSKDKGMKDIAV
jgi:hypothetical protein